MVKTSIEWVFAIITLMCVSCGDRGHQREPSPSTGDQGTPRPPTTVEQGTKVNFDTLPYNLTIDNDPPCQSIDGSHSLVNLRPHFPAELGWTDLPELDAWPKKSLNLSDIEGDSSEDYDLSQIGAGFLEGDLIIKWKDPAAKTKVIIWEFGYYSSKQDKILRLAKTYLLVKDNDITMFSNGTSEQLKPIVSQVSQKSGQTTLRLSLNQIENVATYPVWWIRGILKQGNGTGEQMDTTQGLMLNSQFNQDVRLFSISQCHLNLPPPFDGRVSVLKDSRSVAEDATTSFFENKFFTHYRKFVSFAFLSNKIEASRSVSYPIFHLTSKDIQPIEGFWKGDSLSIDDNAGLTSSTLGWITNTKDYESPTDSFPEATLLTGFSKIITEQFLREGWGSAPIEILELGKSFLFSKWAANLLGNRYWLEYIASTKDSENFVDGKLPREIEPSLGFKRSSILLGDYIGVREFLLAWNAMKLIDPVTLAEGLSEIAIQFSEKLAAYLDKFDNKVPLLSGWMIPGPFSPLLEPSLLNDTDGDGLPSFLEHKLGTDPSKRDSDQDHWDDAGEWLLNHSPINFSDTPNIIVADGDFGDWQKLIPRRIHVDRGRSGACSVKADIELYAAMARPDSVIVGAYVTEFWDGDKDAVWEVDLDITSAKKRFMLTAAGGSHRIYLDTVTGGEGNVPLQRSHHRTFHSGYILAHRVFEFSLHQRDLDITSKLDTPEAIKVRIRTRYPATNPQFCDETEWFEPVLSSN